MYIYTFDQATLLCGAYTDFNITHSKSKDVQNKCFHHTGLFQPGRWQCLNKLSNIFFLTNEYTKDKT